MPLVAALVATASAAEPVAQGANLIQAPGAKLGSAAARKSLRQLRRLGANTVALIPFLWQPGPADPNLVIGDAVSDDELRAGIRAARDAGLSVLLKPHVWVPQTWAGAVRMNSAPDWDTWSKNYRRALLHYASLAQSEGVDALAVGVELNEAESQPFWGGLISEIRAVFHGRLTYVAHNPERGAALPFAAQLDFLGVNLYPDLSGRTTPEAIGEGIRAAAAGVATVRAKHGKPVWVTELGLRALADAHREPWRSPEERLGEPDPFAQARLLVQWQEALAEVRADGVLIWYWSSDPDAGGARDTDFLVQHKPAVDVLWCYWHRACR